MSKDEVQVVPCLPLFSQLLMSHDCFFSCLGRSMAHYQAKCLSQDHHWERHTMFSSTSHPNILEWFFWRPNTLTLVFGVGGLQTRELPTRQAQHSLFLPCLFPYMINSTKRSHEITNCKQSWKGRKQLVTYCETQSPRPDLLGTRWIKYNFRLHLRRKMQILNIKKAYGAGCYNMLIVYIF